MADATMTCFAIDGPVLIRPDRYKDDRGWFCETWSRAGWRDAGFPDTDWVQDNEAYSPQPATIRGLHFQAPPWAQAKLVRCVQGAIFDAIVDIRKGSATYGKALTLTLRAECGEQFFVPEGFAHGYQTLEAHTRVTYKVNAPYAPQNQGGVLWADPKMAIDWPEMVNAVMADRDRHWPVLDDFDSPFTLPDR